MVMKYSYESKLAPFIEGLIKQKQSDGFKYQANEQLLKRLDTFLVKEFPNEETITYEVAAKWSQACDGECKAYHNRRISIMKTLSIYIISLGKDAFIPNSFKCKSYRSVLYIPTKEEVAELIKAMSQPTSNNRVQARITKECKVLFLLYFCCGLRLSEGRLLKKENVDAEKGILVILNSKGQKDRLVYLPNDGIETITEYQAYIETMCPDIPWMFPGSNPNKPISCTGVESTFNRYWNALHNTDVLAKHPTPHCLRHAFVVERLNDWMLKGIDTNAMLPYLSRYLGHKSPDETYYYYHLVDKAFDVIRNKDVTSGNVIPEVLPYEE
jgi:integrase